MGKKRQKVQWFPVDGLAWAGGEDGALQVGGGHQVATRARSHVQCCIIIYCMHRAAATTEILQVIPQITLCYSAASALIIVPTAALQL